jgi:hypothetical protein
MTADEFTARQSTLGLTNRLLADKLNCDEGSVSKWKRGQTTIPEYIAGYLDLLVYVHQNALQVTFTLGELIALSDRAQKRGMTVNAYLVDLVRQDISTAHSTFISYLPDTTASLKVAQDPPHSAPPHKPALNKPADDV